MAEEIRFDQPLLEGIRSSNFFNGRFLTADALETEQTAAAARLRLLGLAVGAGVVRGLVVKVVPPKTAGAPKVKLSVTAGLAINELGETVSLGKDVELPLSVTETASDTLCYGDFDECGKQTVTQVDAGLYLVTIAPVSGFDTRERVPKTSPDSAGKVTGCGYRYRLDGVQFKLQKVDYSGVSSDRLRNMAAHHFFRTEKAGAGATEEAEIALANPKPEVPLALVHWQSGSIQFIDIWSVRRRCEPRPDVSLGTLSPLNGRRLAEAEAVFLQFQDHVKSLGAGGLGSAQERFRYLPRAGILPITAVEEFFKGFAVTLGVLDPIWHRKAIHDSLFLEPADLEDDLAVTLALPVRGAGGKSALGLSSVYLVETAEERVAETLRKYAGKHEGAVWSFGAEAAQPSEYRFVVQSLGSSRLERLLNELGETFGWGGIATEAAESKSGSKLTGEFNVIQEWSPPTGLVKGEMFKMAGGSPEADERFEPAFTMTGGAVAKPTEAVPKAEPVVSEANVAEVKVMDLAAPPAPEAAVTAKAEPVMTATAKMEPVMTVAAQVEPAVTVAAKVEPVMTATAKVEPAVTVAAKVEPAVTVTAKAEPAVTVTAKAEPVATAPAKAEPAETVTKPGGAVSGEETVVKPAATGLRIYAVNDKADALFLITPRGLGGKGPWEYVRTRYDSR